MKIDTTEPRIPLHRLKHPVMPKSTPLAAVDENETGDKIEKMDNVEFSDAFERAIIENGAKKFREWLDRMGIK